MIIPTRFGAKTVISDDLVKPIFGKVIYCLLGDISEYGLKRGQVLFYNRKNQNFSIYNSLDDVIVACLSIKGRYGYRDVPSLNGELQCLHEWYKVNRKYTWMLLDWKDMNSEQRERYTQICIEMAEDLQNVRDEDKRTVLKWMIMAKSVTDSRGRENINRTTNLHGFSANRLENRIENVLNIAEKIDFRRIALFRYRESIVLLVECAEDDLLNMMKMIDILQKKPKRSHDIIEEFFRVGENVLNRLLECNDRPWFHASNRSIEDIRSALICVRGGYLESGKKKLNVAYVSMLGLKEYNRIAYFRFRFIQVSSRKPRNTRELEYLLEELQELRLSLDGDSVVYNTKMMKRVKSILDGALAEWRIGDLQKAREKLSNAGHPF